jgi:hypothetical protein
VHDPARVDDPLGEDRGGAGYLVPQRQRPQGVALARDRRLLLDGDRDALQRPGRFPRLRVPLLRGPGRGQGLLVERIGEGVDGRLDRLGPLDDRRHQLDRGQFAGPEQG